MQGARQLNAKSATDAAASPESLNGFSLVPVLGLGIICLLTFVCYSPVLFNFFVGDDFVHLTWLSQAIHHPDLVARNFYTSWLDGTTTKFYRPLISVFMVSDYALWGVNGFGFRLTNIIFHLASTLFIFLITRQLQYDAEGQNHSKHNSFSRSAWPLCAAALFALYPLHPEAVSWITGRVDSVVTAFCFGAVYFYIIYSRLQQRIWMALSLVSSILALLSKEMAITLPAVFVLYELVYNYRSDSGAFPVKLLLNAVKKTLPFWLLLGLYFGIRYLALGTFVGGYDNSLLFIANPREFVAGWLHALKMFLVPINKTLMGAHHIVSKIWPAALIVCSGLSCIDILQNPQCRRHFFFLAGWLLLCLAPVYKLFAISDDLQGSRLAYLATVPLCMLLMSALSNNEKLERWNWWNTARIVSTVTLLALSACLLWTNNQAWRMAGEENNAIRGELNKLYGKISGDPEVLLLGLPDQINGAYTCRNSLDGMTKRPQLFRDVRRCLMVNPFEPIFPFAYLKESIRQNSNKIFVFRWDSQTKSFVSIQLPSANEARPRIWHKEDLSRCISVPEQKAKPQVHATEDGSIHYVTNAGPERQFVELDLGRQSCFTTDFIEVSLSLDKPADSDAGAELLYCNDMNPAFELKRRVHSPLSANKKEQRLFFALRGLPEWALGGMTGHFRLLLPGNSKGTVNSVSIVPPMSVMPQISFANSDYFGSKGYLHLGPNQKEQILNVDLQNVQGAKKFCVEISRANLLFEEQNPQCYSKVAREHKIYEHTKGNVVLNFDAYQTPGIYELRVFPLAEDGTICGAASDHIVLSID